MIAQITILKEGIAVGISCNKDKGKPWADYYLVGEKADKVTDMLVDIINNGEPVIGDKSTMRAYVAHSKKRKGKRK